MQLYQCKPGTAVRIAATDNPFASRHVGKIGRVLRPAPDGRMVVIEIDDGGPCEAWWTPEHLIHS